MSCSPLFTEEIIMHIAFSSLLLSMLLSATTMSQAARSAVDTNRLAQSTYAKLSALVGDWQGQYADGRKLSVTYRLTANNTALVETWTMSPTRESMTIYTLDGDRLLATHYCPQGNQPRLQLSRLDAQGKYQFEFVDGGNLQKPDASHQHQMWLKLESADRFSRSEIYVQNGSQFDPTKAKDEVVTFTRVALEKSRRASGTTDKSRRIGDTTDKSRRTGDTTDK
jgi:hypothetical protein